MDPETPSENDVAGCCADFYNHPMVVKLLDGIFHPGGLALSKLMATKMGIDANSKVLDIACGDGMTATYLAKVLRCNVSGVDASQEMIEAAKERAKNLRVEDRTDFKVSLASKIPHDANSFTAVISECSLCTFPNKDRATNEISRVLARGGILGLNDVTIKNHDDLDDELRGLLGLVACVADALSAEEYVVLFELKGFNLVDSSTHSELLEDMARKAKGRARFFMEIGGEKDDANKMAEAIRMIDLIEKQIQSGNIGYKLFIFQLK